MIDLERENRVLTDLAPAPYKAPADHLAYDAPAVTSNPGSDPMAGLEVGSRALPKKRVSETISKTSAALPIGTQAYLVAAARAAEGIGCKLNTLITIRWTHDRHDGPRYLSGPAHRRPRLFIKALRRVICPRYCKSFVYIWCREVCPLGMDHWHIAFHARKKAHRAIEERLAVLTDEPAVPPSATSMTEGEIARGACGTWQLSANTDPDGSGMQLAAYLGKGEPSWVKKHGSWVANTAKPFRGDEKPLGRTVKGKYDTPQGEIAGTNTRYNRFDTAKLLKKEIGTFKGRWDRL